MRARGDDRIRREVSELMQEGRAVLCHLVRLELWNGARGKAERRWLRELETSIETVVTTVPVWDLAMNFAQRSRDAGVTIPASDLVIFACARHYGLRILHRDSHFDSLERIEA